MKARIIIIDDIGNTVLQGEVQLTATMGASRVTKVRKNSINAPQGGALATKKLNFDKNPRAFMKSYATKLNGAQKFTLLVARLAKGHCGTNVPFSDINRAWGKMTGILGKNNPAHSIRAREHGWVDTPEFGSYVLCPSWQDILTS